MVKATVSSIGPGNEMCAEPLPDRCGFIIFGASGDLTKRKLIPALYHMWQGGLLPDRWYVLGLGRTRMDDRHYRESVKESLDRYLCAETIPADQWEQFGRRLHYLSGDSQSADYYTLLGEKLNQLDKEHDTGGRRLFYLAAPPDLYLGIIHRLGQAGLNRSSMTSGWSRIVIEKPVGRDLASARALNQAVVRVFDEHQVYRIDHYLGKETVQNILFFRFANAIFEPIWNRRYIDHIQITVAEQIGIEHRAGYYEQAGALRDMFQNHLLQLFCLVAMEPPASFEADAVRDEKGKVLKAVRPIPLDRHELYAVRGQYASGVLGGEEAVGYRDERGVAPDSKTETYAALKLFVDNWRWQGVPFYLRSGKRMAKRSAEIAIEFRQVPHLFFNSLIPEEIQPNVLVFRIQPDEGISMTLQAKHPGPKLCLDRVTMDFKYRDSFTVASRDDYERLLLDCLIGDQMLFARGDWVELSWSLLTPLLEQWQQGSGENLVSYQAGSWGPVEADDLIQRDGRSWRLL